MISYVNEPLFKLNSISKDFEIVFDSGVITDSELYEQELEITESLCSEQQLVFGSCEASQIKFKVGGVSDSLKGKTITVSVVLNGDTNNPFLVGTYKVDSDRPDADRNFREVIAYDGLYDIINADVAGWYNGLTFPITLKNFRDSFFLHLGITQQTTTLANDSMSIEKTIFPETLSGKDVICAICEINGCFGHIGRDGEFKYIFLDPTSPTTISESVRMSSDYEDYIVQKVDKLQIRQESGDIGVVVGTGNNVLVVESNFLCFGKATNELNTIARNLFEVVRKVTYRPAEVKCMGNPCIEVGDYITATGAKATINTFVLQRTLSGIQALTDIYHADGTETRDSEVNSIQSQFAQIRGKSNVLTRTIEQTQSTITELTEATIGTSPNSLQSQITQQAGSISAKVEQTTFDTTIDNLQRQIDSSFETYNVNYVPTLDNFPAYDWCATPILDVSLFDANGEIPWTYTNDSYSAHARTQVYNTETGISYRFSKDSNGVWYWEVIANSDYALVNKKISDLEIDLEGFKTTVSDEYLKIDEASGTYETISSCESKIAQSATSITSSVSQTYQTINSAQNDLVEAKTYADGVGASVLTSAESKISQSATAITTSVSATYETKDNASTNYTSLSTSISQTAESISSEVTRATTAEGTLSTSITQASNAISAEVTRATDAEGTLSSAIKLKPDNISLSISNDSTTAGITIGWKENGVAKSATGTINMTGLVSFTNLSSAHSSTNNTVINGGHITTGKITVGSSNNVLFEADITSAKVKIAGFEVSKTSLYSNSKKTIDENIDGVYVGSDGISCGKVVKYHKFSNGEYSGVNSSVFKVTKDGDIYTAGGSITVGSGESTYTYIQSGKIYLSASAGKPSNGYYTYTDYDQITMAYQSSAYNINTEDYGAAVTIKGVHSSITSQIAKIAYSRGSYLFTIGNSNAGIGFFGTTPSTKLTVNKLSSSATLSNAVTKINDLLTALKTYGLISSS